MSGMMRRFEGKPFVLRIICRSILSLDKWQLIYSLLTPMLLEYKIHFCQSKHGKT